MFIPPAILVPFIIMGGVLLLAFALIVFVRISREAKQFSDEVDEENEAPHPAVRDVQIVGPEGVSHRIERDEQ